MNKLTNIFLIGPMGSGKTTIGRHLARELKMDFYDSDREIEQRTGVTIPWIFDLEGEAGFRKREKQVIEELTQKEGVVIATGGGAILHPDNQQRLQNHGIIVYLRVSIEEQINRTNKGHNRPLLEKANLKETLESINAAREPSYLKMADLTLDTHNSSIPSIVSEIAKHIFSLRQQKSHDK